MTIATSLMTLKEYLAYGEGTDAFHELENGELIAMPPESDLNRRIATFLLIHFARVGISPQCLTMKTEILVSGARATVRLPDLMVLSAELLNALEGATRSTVMLDMPPPCLVIEVVSPGKRNVDRDYRYKRTQYEARGIAEYWIVDPITQQVTILTLVEGLYEETRFIGETEIFSPLLVQQSSKIRLTANHILSAGV